MVRDGFDPLIPCHRLAVRPLQTGTVEVGGVRDRPLQTGMGLADLNQEVIEALSLVENPADLVDRVPIGRDRPEGSAQPTDWMPQAVAS